MWPFLVQESGLPEGWLRERVCQRRIKHLKLSVCSSLAAQQRCQAAFGSGEAEGRSQQGEEGKVQRDTGSSRDCDGGRGEKKIPVCHLVEGLKL